MKGLLILLCVFAAAQARSSGGAREKALAVLGENPWIVHLRLAVSTGGHVETCAGSLIGHEWVLTAFSCIRYHRFIWVRKGLVEVIRPSLVTETNLVRTHPTLDLALISISRHVEYTDTIGPVAIARSNADAPATGKFCGFGANENGAPGEDLACFDVNVEVQEDGTLVGTSDDGETTSYDVGAPLVVDGVQYGVLVQSGERSVFINPAVARDWIEATTGIDLGGDDSEEDGSGDSSEEDSDNGDGDGDNGEGDSEEEDSSSSSSSSEESDEARVVRFIN